MATTINNIELENESADDASFTLDDAKREQESLDSVDLEDTEETSEKQVDAELLEDMEKLDIEQIPLGTDKILLNRRNVTKEGEVLLFENEDESVPEQNIDELDSEELDGEDDPDFDAELAETQNRDEQSKDEECEDSSRESVDGNDLQGTAVQVRGPSPSNCKLVFDDVAQYKKEQAAESEDECEEGQVGMGTECLVTENMEEYDESRDPDFNPVYCDQTLSDVELEDTQNEESPEVLQLKNDTCMLKVENMKIPPVAAPVSDMEE